MLGHIMEQEQIPRLIVYSLCIYFKCTTPQMCTFKQKSSHLRKYETFWLVWRNNCRRTCRFKIVCVFNPCLTLFLTHIFLQSNTGSPQSQRPADLSDDEVNELFQRLAEVQQEKWLLEEKVWLLRCCKICFSAKKDFFVAEFEKLFLSIWA